MKEARNQAKRAFVNESEITQNLNKGVFLNVLSFFSMF